MQRKSRKGVATLGILIFLSGLLAVMLLFDDSTLRFFRAQQMQRKNYVERTLALQKMTFSEKQQACLALPLDNPDRVRQVFINIAGAEDAIRYSLWCQRVAIFKKSPTKGDNQGQLTNFIQMKNLNEFRPHFTTLSNPLIANKIPQLYWFQGDKTEWEVDGTVPGILVAEGDLILRGKGRISGAVITGGSLSLEGVTVAYGKKMVEPLVQQYSKWQLAEKSWSDFSPSNE
ncbi:DUF2572 family protein [Rodentibacter trehalosifermentans]|uniref:DUF2572 domain-containing protein n=1 Tax=Rodentibacter trehalosifermentans TaxID=1908263 RepID=A0A1V3IXH9_9PAST|nr:DUF2572 family protein [Rodentibacter trehalosifermentans]OOF44533.1 hypothetical protein BKK51_08590 [Rodentibacter trehalosifermentans]OOF46688.1 hypothetical protein BKK52_10905 [Rodentibacter trehalosifermentans]OOF52519.1 hypothetical protein BKK53_04955 [Rodentibacter trehalosifermentans]